VILVREFLSNEECADLIAAGDGMLVASPSISGDDSAFKDYRTSSTAHIHRASISQTIKSRAQYVVRLPFRGFVEAVQLVKYQAGQYFKKHTDYFDHFDLSDKLRRLQRNPDGTNAATLAGWASWTQQRIAYHGDAVSVEVQEGGRLYPSESDDFQLALIELLIKDPSNELWTQLGDEWSAWVRENFSKKAGGIVTSLLSGDVEKASTVFEGLRKLWEKVAGSRLTYE
jgi:hypothetical protein